MAAFNFFKLSLLLSLFSNTNLRIRPEHSSHGNAEVMPIPAACNHVECPTYEVYDVYNGFEIRRYNSTVWISTSPVSGLPLELATFWGYQSLRTFASGKMNMTAPLITTVNPCDGTATMCMQTYASSYYVPKKNQANPPSSGQLVVKKWASVYVAVRRFPEPVSEFTVRAQALALYKSLTPAFWFIPVRRGEYGMLGIYNVVQYTSVDHDEETVNEIWLKFVEDYVYPE